jgi:CheY-like chemotaxis protein
MNKKCLIIDDVEVSRYVLGVHLAELGFTVFEAIDEESALELLSKEKFDVAIVDWHLRHSSGLDFIPKMRKVRGGETMPIIVCSGVEQGDKMDSTAKQSGAHAFLSKPVSREQLEAELKRVRAL